MKLEEFYINFILILKSLRLAYDSYIKSTNLDKISQIIIYKISFFIIKYHLLK